MAYSPRRRAILDRSRKQFRAGQWLNEEEFWSQMEKTPSSKGQAKPRKKRA